MENSTNLEQEQLKGRMALWLSPEQIAFLANEWRKIPENASMNVKQNWSNIAFRCMSALHKANIEYTPEFPQEVEKYCLTLASSELPSTSVDGSLLSFVAPAVTELKR